MDEEELQASITAYKEQLSQIEAALSATDDDDTRQQLSKLQGDLNELVQLTEASLLSLRKSNLLAALDPSPPTPTPPPNDDATAKVDLDAEYAAFQALISSEDKTAESTNTQAEMKGDETKAHVDGEEVAGEISQEYTEEDGDDADLTEIIGTKCRVPFSQQWGSHSYYNAMVIAAEPLDSDSEPKVRVLFCNPTQRSMVPCPFFLEDRCKFDVDQCRFSHGEIVEVEELEEFKEPDYSVLQMETKCLARYHDDVWYPAKVIDVLEDHKFTVLYEAYGNTETVPIEDILPQDEEEVESEDEESSRTKELHLDDEDDDDALPVYLWRPNQTTDILGEWEKHTKGFGSRLMAKMGYIVGQGLGKTGEGRAEPVPIQLLPPGKSLDKIMELKEQAGDQDLYDVMKRQRRKQRKVDDKHAHQYKKATTKKINVFDFINKKLAGKKGNLSELRHRSKGPEKFSDSVTIGKADLTKRTNKEVNLQLFKTHGEIKKVEKEIQRLKKSLERNDGRDNKMAGQVRQQLASMESYRRDLLSSQSSMQKHQQMRSDHKKLTVF